MKNILYIVLAGVFSLTVACTQDNHSMKKGVTIENVAVVNEFDPICGMSTVEYLKDTLTFEGKLYGFCNTKCKEEFKENPKNYIKEK